MRYDLTACINFNYSVLFSQSLGLGLLPPTPPVSFEPIDTKTPKDGAGQTHLDNIKMPRDPGNTLTY